MGKILRLSDVFPRSGFIDAADQSCHRLYYEDYGPKDAPAIIMVHGNAGALFDPQKLRMFDLSRQRVIIPHLRGIGRSQPAGAIEGNLYPDLAHDIETLRAHLEINKVSLFGWSGGAAIALLYTQGYPERCQDITLFGAFLGTKQELEEYYQRSRDKYPQGWRDFCAAYNTTDQSVALRLNNHRILTGTASQRQEAALRYERIFGPVDASAFDLERLAHNRMVFAHMQEHDYGLAPHQIANNMGKIAAIPLTVASGAEDYVTPFSTAARLLPQARHIVIEGVGHDIHGRKVQDFFRHLFVLGLKRSSFKPSGFQP